LTTQRQNGDEGLASGAALVLLDSTTGKETEWLATLPRTAGLPLALVDETGKWAVASTTEGKEFTLVDLSARKAVVRKGHDSVIRAVGFVPGGKRLITCNAEATLRVWEHGIDRPVKVFKSRDRTKRETAQEIRVSADGRWAAVSTRDEGGLTWVWDLTTGREVASYAGAERVVFSPDGQMLAIHLTGSAKRNASPEDKPTAHRMKLVPVRDWETR
jgi:WD40 repeat protein